MSWEKAKLINETIKEFLICAAIITGGCWAVYTFWITERNEISPRPELSTSMETTLIYGEKEKYIKAEVTIKNLGNDIAWIYLNPLSSISLHNVKFDSKGDDISELMAKKPFLGYLNNNMNKLETVTSYSISPNSPVELSFLLKVNNDFQGMVRATFLASYIDDVMRKELDEQGYNGKVVLSLQSNDYVYINR